MRDYLNDGGKLLYTGQDAAFGQLSGFAYNPAGQPPYCAPGGEPNCVPLSNDFLQYCLGAYLHIDAAATKEGEASALPSGPPAARSDRADRAQRRRQRGQPVPRLLDGDHVEHPAGGDLPAVRVRAGRAVQHRPPALDTAHGLVVQVAKAEQLLPAAAQDRRPDRRHRADLSFKVSYDTEEAYDYVIVEAHTVGQDDWTTLPDANGNTSADVGESCDINWDTLHPFLAHYQTNVNKSTDPAQKDCTATGTTGAWNGATGNSGGFEDWKIDLSAYHGRQVEVSISYVQDFGTAGLGVFVDDAGSPDGQAAGRRHSRTGSAASPSAARLRAASPNSNNWIRSEALFEEYAGIKTR